MNRQRSGFDRLTVFWEVKTNAAFSLFKEGQRSHK